MVISWSSSSNRTKRVNPASNEPSGRGGGVGSGSGSVSGGSGVGVAVGSARASLGMSAGSGGSDVWMSSSGSRMANSRASRETDRIRRMVSSDVRVVFFCLGCVLDLFCSA